MRRLLELSPREVGDLLVAQRIILVAWLQVRRQPTGELLRRVRQTPIADDRSLDERRLTRIAVAVDRVSRFGVVRPTCLVRAIALERLVRGGKSGAAVVRVGVLRDSDAFFAHAWIEIEGRVFGDEPAYVRRFTPLHDFSALAS
jgi:hypothetical protein